ncbi:hypothetical protein ACF09K_12105 [Streptomyces sp. NPDC014882]|uniref:hypothetical protein n=1 Tax=Streptomyces sp. NPDC014882 TaxID=3364927 RepID=UPI0036F646E7
MAVDLHPDVDVEVGRMAGRVRGTAVVLALSVAASAAVSGCGAVSERRDDVRTATAAFEDALGEGAYARACGGLAPATVEELEQSAGAPCARALGEESLKPGGAVRVVDVYGNQARAVLARDTLFLSHFATGWKVVAAGCAPRPGTPYQCEIKGG